MDAGKPILYIFSGSDWCAPCKRLDKQVWSDTLWQAFAERRLTEVRVDFPRGKTLPAEQRLRNEALAERFNPELRFPFLVLTVPDGAWLEAVPSRAADAQEMINRVERLLHAHHAPD